MNTRVSQLELRQTVDLDSNRIESSNLHPERSLPPSSTIPLAADSSNDTSSLCSDPSFTKPESLSSRIPYYLIGLLLTATAIAKLWMLLTDSFADIRVGLPKEILWLSVAFELWLAFENFRIRDHRVMAFINTIVFASFAVFASVRLAMGYSSCGCSGSLEIPAWVFVVVDSVIVTWFASSTARRIQIGNGLRQLLHGWSSWSPEKRGHIAGAILFVALLVGLQFPVADPLRAIIFGEPQIQAVVRIGGDLYLNQETTGRVDIQNRSGLPAKVIGNSRSCRCFDLAEYPISKIIPANGQITLPLVIKPNKIGLLHQRVELFLHHPKQFRVIIDVIGSVKKEN